MNVKTRWISAVLAICVCFATLAGCNQPSEKTYEPLLLKEAEEVKNVILLIGDGMGPEQIKAGEVRNGEPLTMQRFPYQTKVETRSNNSEITDSAAAGTALATGQRTNNGIVGISPTNYQDLETIMDVAKSLGKRTGVLATEPISGATPMSFLSHSMSRDNTDELISVAVGSGVNLIASDTIDENEVQAFVDGGYEHLANADNISSSEAEYVIGSYNISPNAEYGECSDSLLAFDRLVTEALEYLSQDEDGFVLMAEGSHIDHGGHENNIQYMLRELLAFDRAVKAVYEWAKDRNDTVVLVTADHETGGFALKDGATADNLFEMTYKEGTKILIPKYYSWSTKGHSATDVNLYVNGANIDFSQYSFDNKDRIKNVDVFEIMKNLITKQ